MERIEQICAQLAQKKEKFEQYEAATQALLNCDADAVEQYITQRGEIATEIDAISEQIGALCDGQQWGTLLMDATAAKVPFSNLPPELHPVYEAGQAVRSVAFRIPSLDAQVVKRLEGFKADAQQKLKEMQNVPKIKKYLTDLSEKPEQHSLTNGKA